MVKDLAKWAQAVGVKYFMVSYTDLFGGQRAKLVPWQAINEMAVEGAGFAGFAIWLDLTPAHPDLMAIPDADALIQLPWKPEVAWLPARPTMDGGCAGRPSAAQRAGTHGGRGRQSGSARENRGRA